MLHILLSSALFFIDGKLPPTPPVHRDFPPKKHYADSLAELDKLVAKTYDEKSYQTLLVVKKTDKIPFTSLEPTQQVAVMLTYATRCEQVLRDTEKNWIRTVVKTSNQKFKNKDEEAKFFSQCATKTEIRKALVELYQKRRKAAEKHEEMAERLFDLYAGHVTGNEAHAYISTLKQRHDEDNDLLGRSLSSFFKFDVRFPAKKPPNHRKDSLMPVD